jgi:hypothetical protein
LLVRHTCDDQGEDLTLPGGQLGQSGPHADEPFPVRLALPILDECLVYRVDQRLIIKGFREDLQGARSHRPNGQCHVGMGGNENDWQLVLLFEQPTLQLQAAAARHPDVENQATGRRAFELRGNSSADAKS